MIDGPMLAALAERFDDAAAEHDQLRREYRTAAAALANASSGRVLSAAADAGARITAETGEFERSAGRLRALASAVSGLAEAVSMSAAEHGLIDTAERRELTAARFRDGGIDGAHTMIAAALIAADRDAVDDDLVDAAGQAAGQRSDAGPIPFGTLSMGALTGVSASLGLHSAAVSDHDGDAELRRQIQNRLVELAPHFPIHLPGWRVAVGLCRDDDSDRIVVATPEPAPYLRPGFVLRVDETHVGAGIEPELALLNYAQAQALSVIAIATTGAVGEVLDVLADCHVDVLDPLGFADG